MKCDIIAEGIVAAAKEISLKVPLVVRLEGTNVELGKEILAKSGLPIISAARSRRRRAEDRQGREGQIDDRVASSPLVRPGRCSRCTAQLTVGANMPIRGFLEPARRSLASADRPSRARNAWRIGTAVDRQGTRARSVTSVARTPKRTRSMPTDARLVYFASGQQLRSERLCRWICYATAPATRSSLTALPGPRRKTSSDRRTCYLNSNLHRLIRYLNAEVQATISMAL